MEYALIIEGRIHQVIEDLSITKVPVWPPFPDGTKPLLIDITGKGAKEGDKYDENTGKIMIKPDMPSPASWNNYPPFIWWDDDAFVWVVDYKASIMEAINEIKAEIASHDYRAAKVIKLGLTMDEVYPDEKEWYLEKIAELEQVEGLLQELEGFPNGIPL